ncbi:hypothetical protein ACU8KH_00985 [Lachancea thermotolerans]
MAVKKALATRPSNFVEYNSYDVVSKKLMKHRASRVKHHTTSSNCLPFNISFNNFRVSINSRKGNSKLKSNNTLKTLISFHMLSTSGSVAFKIIQVNTPCAFAFSKMKPRLTTQTTLSVDVSRLVMLPQVQFRQALFINSFFGLQLRETSCCLSWDKVVSALAVTCNEADDSWNSVVKQFFKNKKAYRMDFLPATIHESYLRMIPLVEGLVHALLLKKIPLLKRIETKFRKTLRTQMDRPLVGTPNESKESLKLPRDVFSNRLFYMISRNRVVFFTETFELSVAAFLIQTTCPSSKGAAIFFMMFFGLLLALITGLLINFAMKRVATDSVMELQFMKEIAAIKPGMDMKDWDVLAARMNTYLSSNMKYASYQNANIASGSQPFIHKAIKIHEERANEDWEGILNKSRWFEQ